ncbi:MAG TPA: class I SAM-dependent methyltransferase [Mycobacteriales bacterium]|nr:class I SAM-dependent methyltransferase [Mycobacteriales bacterium]
MPNQSKIDIELHGVPETLLWNLYHRATAAGGNTPSLDDPKAVELVERINYPFERFGTDQAQAGQWHALRVRCFDDEIRRFLREHPAGTVVALGEGLETQFWRVDNGTLTWLTVDLPETVAVRQKLLPDGPRNRTIACSATDEEWLTHVDATNGVLISAQGLLMYFQPAEVDQLIAMCGQQLPGSGLLFDTVPEWMISRRDAWLDQEKDGTGYRPPPWVWGMTRAERSRLAGLPEIARLRNLRQPRGRGLAFGVILPVLQRIPFLRYRLPSFPIMLARLR